VILHEAKQGKSHALNSGLHHVSADSDLIILTDDDVIADPQWLKSFAQAALALPEFSIFGGEIRPAWETEPPQWIFEWVNTRMVFALNEGTAEGEINPDLVFGPNSAFRAHLFLKEGNRIPTHIGPKSGGAYPMGNDSALAKLLSDQGHRAYHVPSAIVSHMIPAKNLDEDWIVRRAERYGWGQVVQHPEWFTAYKMPSLFGLRKRIRFLLHSVLFFFAEKFMSHSRKRYNILYWYYYQKGLFRGLKDLS
jgi:GT2 family glycosyltransferase